MTSVPPPSWQPASVPTPDPEPPVTAHRGAPRLIAVLAALAVLAGGGFAVFGSTASKLTDPVAEAATVSSGIGGYRAHLSLQLVSSSMPGPITASGSGTVDARDHAGELTFAINFGSIPQVTQMLGSETLRIAEIVDGTTVYLKLLGQQAGVLAMLGQRWLKLDLAKALHLPGLSSLESNPATTDPSQLLQYLRAVSDSVVAEGRQVVDGFQTTHYRAYLNLDAVSNVLPPADQAAAQQSIGTLEQESGLHTVPIDVWVDARHLVRRMQEGIDTTLPSGQTFQMSMTLDLSDYGPQAPPTLPPAGDVQNLSTLVGSLGR
jgi:hypothetical protein